MIAFINEHHDIHGVEPICKVLPIAPFTHCLYAVRHRDPLGRVYASFADRGGPILLGPA